MVRKSGRVLSLCAVPLLGSCYVGLDGGPTEIEETEGDKDTTPEEELPEEAEEEHVEIGSTIAPPVACVGIDEGQQVLGVDPNGELVLRTATHDALHLPSERTMVSPENTTATVSFGDHLVYIEDGELKSEWDGVSHPTKWPDDLPSPTSFCGDPALAADGFVAANDTLAQRDAGQWWLWSKPGGAGFGSVTGFATAFGACLDEQQGAWIQFDDDTVWRVSGQSTWKAEPLTGATSLTFGPHGVVAVVSGDLIYGGVNGGVSTGFIRPIFERMTMVHSAAASTDATWAIVGDDLLSYDGEEWSRVTSEIATLVDDAFLLGAPEGVWVVREDQACSVGASPTIQVRGLRPLQRLAGKRVEFRIDGAEDDVVEVRIDGASVTGASNGDAWSYTADLDGNGWHDFAVDVGESLRSFRFESRPIGAGNWTADVEPLAIEHCGIAGCHDPDVADRPDFTTYESWVENADAIFARVAVAHDMPPPATSLETWGAAEVSLVSNWIRAGLPENDE